MANNSMWSDSNHVTVNYYDDQHVGAPYISNHGNPIIEIDSAEQPVTPTLVLATKKTKLGVIYNIDSFTYRHAMNDVDEISFNVTKDINGEEFALWDYLTDFKLVYIPHYDAWFEIRVTLNEDDETVKSVSGLHAQESELSQRLIFETEINTEDDIAREDYRVTVFYDENHPDGSLLNRLLADKGQDYSIYYVSPSLKTIQRSFSFNNKSIKDCLDDVADEVECLFVYGEHLSSDGILHRTISAYDLLDYCNACGERGNFSGGICTECGSSNIVYGYGDDTGIFISRENIASSVTLDTNANNVKNCFRLEGGDDVMTAVIRSINPNGSQYIWNFTDEMKADMSTELQTALNDYDTLYNSYRDSQEMTVVPTDLLTSYNTLVNKYSSLNDNLETIDIPIMGTTALVNADYQIRYMYDFLKNIMMPGSPEVEETTAEDEEEEETEEEEDVEVDV